MYQSPPVAVAPPIPNVAVKKIEPQKVRIWSEFSGRLQAVDSAEIRPQVSGRITEVHFEDGAFVKVGDLLFVIDPRPYEAADSAIFPASIKNNCPSSCSIRLRSN